MIEVNITSINEPLITSTQNVCDVFDWWICVVIVGTLCLTGTMGNIFSLIVFTKHKVTFESDSIFLLKSLAVSDTILLLTTLIVYVPIAIKWEGRSQINAYIWPIAMMSHTSTVWITVLLTYNRYQAQNLHRPQSFLSVQQKIALLVFLTIIYNTPRFFEHRQIITETKNGTNTYVDLGQSRTYQIIYSNILYYPVMFLIPLCLLIYLNIGLLNTLKTLKQKRRLLVGHHIKDDHITLIIVVIVFLFIICQTPALINQIFFATLSNENRDCGKFHYFYTKISDVLVIFNSSVNFAIYCLFGKSFRKVFWDTLLRRSSNYNNPRSTVTTRKLSGVTCV